MLDIYGSNIENAKKKEKKKEKKKHHVILCNWKACLPYIYASRTSLNMGITRMVDNNRQTRD